MISAQEIADWRVMAPWSTDDMVEQDFLICRAVAAIFEDKFLAGQVAMRGGTVLHKGHLAGGVSRARSLSNARGQGDEPPPPARTSPESSDA